MAEFRIAPFDGNAHEAGVALETQLRAVNNDLAPGEDYAPMAWFLTDGAGNQRGGVFVYARWSVLCVDILVIDQELRGQGHGTALLEKAESWGITKGCREAYLETFQAEPFYRRHGYSELGRRPNYPTGHDLVLMRKELT